MSEQKINNVIIIIIFVFMARVESYFFVLNESVLSASGSTHVHRGASRGYHTCLLYELGFRPILFCFLDEQQI